MAMYDFRGEMDRQMQSCTELLQKFQDSLNETFKENDKFFKSFKQSVNYFNRTGKWPGIAGSSSQDSENPLKENVPAVKKEKPSPTKPKRKALRDTYQVPEKSQSESLLQVSIKKEKVSNVPLNNSKTEMPPPALPIKKAIKVENIRSTRTRTRQQQIAEETNEDSPKKDSDVILKDVTVTVLEVSSDGEDIVNSSATELATTRLTRSKVVKKNIDALPVNGQKRNGSPPVVDKSDQKRPKRTKRKGELEKTDESEHNAFKDTADKTTNPTSEQHALDATYVTLPINSDAPINAMDLNDFMTDDESPQLPVKSKQLADENKPGKTLFSAYATSPVKKRVEAFEKLGAQNQQVTGGMVTRNQQPNRVAASEVRKAKEKAARLQTPTSKNHIPVYSHSASRLLKPPSIEALLAPKAASSAKVSQTDFKERELRRRKLEEKRQAEREEKKRIREEKQLKAQQARAQLEKEKQKQLEAAEKQRQEKQKQIIAEKELRYQKYREESEKKHLAHKKAMGERYKQKPVYLTEKAPLLATSDCYDSDDENRKIAKSKKLPWAREENLKVTVQNAHIIGSKVMNTFFCCTAQTIDLLEVFPGMDPGRTRRNSSAIWDKPPRFTLAPVLDDVTEEGKYDTDN